MNFIEEMIEALGPPEPKKKKAIKAPVPVIESFDGIFPEVLPCGHLNWSTTDANAEAKAQGVCCAQSENPINWFIRGLTEPVPARYQRVASESPQGYSGLCTDPKTHLYIGGVSNDCRLTGGKRCRVHSR